MLLENSLDLMKQDALEMSRYYYKGFAMVINGVLSNAELYVVAPEKKELISGAYYWFEGIDSFYKKIPFNELHGKERFYPLFVVQRLLPIFKESMDGVFEERKDGALKRLGADSKTIVDVGRLYFDSLQDILKNIRSHSEASDFKVKIIDHKNEVWYF